MIFENNWWTLILNPLSMPILGLQTAIIAQEYEIYLLAAIPLKDSAFTGITDSLYMFLIRMLLNSQWSLVITFLVVGIVTFLLGIVTLVGTSLNSCNCCTIHKWLLNLLGYVTMISQLRSQIRRARAPSVGRRMWITLCWPQFYSLWRACPLKCLCVCGARSVPLEIPWKSPVFSTVWVNCVCVCVYTEMFNKMLSLCAFDSAKRCLSEHVCIQTTLVRPSSLLG